MNSEIIEIIANMTVIATFLFFLIGSVLKGFLNLSYVKKTKSDSFKMISEKVASEYLEDLEDPLVINIKSNKCDIEQNFYIKFSERIFDLESLLVNEEAIPRDSIKITKYGKQFIEYDTSIIDIEEALIWSIELREFYSMGKLRWKTATGMIGEFIPKIVGLEEKQTVNIVYKHTLKSFIYHFFQR